jgi:hypothetical protein
MIINAPTGLYKVVLPKDKESGNITYTISSQGPPRQVINAIRIPIAEQFAPAPEPVFDEETHREQFGELVYSSAVSNKNIAGSTTKAFEVGEILSFENQVPVEEINTVRSPDDVVIQHNTNLLDLEGLGLTEEEIDELSKQSASKQSDLEEQFVNKQNEIKVLETQIGETQKIINENHKTLNAVRELLGLEDNEDSDNEVYQKLTNNEVQLQAQIEQLISDRNQASDEVAEIYQSIVRISELVR